ncbi:hypothetical protein PVAND_001270 [Polypedilum vanderplanki]|uniref:C2H2-type domain-containing protein n=1 Tax=Polypedilum vanderplanki TaxID=319348 RepID=A0A9J6BMG3_POLVA|nr:hypothetical protein PVAND_001270 [Polypedilum vanderplanki]
MTMRSKRAFPVDHQLHEDANKKITPETLQSCDFCGFEETHMVYKPRKYSGRFSCKKCSAEYRSIEDLKNHKKVHLIRRSCYYCSLNFPRKPSLRRHIRFMHKEQKQEDIDQLVKEISNMIWNDISNVHYQQSKIQDRRECIER